VQFDQVGENRAAQIRADPLSQPGDQVKARHRTQGHCGADGNDEQHGFAQPGGVAAGKAIVDEYLDSIAQGQLQ